MNLHEYITENNKVVNTLFQSGVLSASVINNYAIYQFYLDSLEVGNSKSMSIELTLYRFEISRKTIYNIINQYSEEV
jgi:hypothetical protein